MTNTYYQAQFIKNNRGMFAGGDFPPEILQDIYQGIKKSEFQIMDEIYQKGNIDGKGWETICRHLLRRDQMYNNILEMLSIASEKYFRNEKFTQLLKKRELPTKHQNFDRAVFNTIYTPFISAATVSNTIKYNLTIVLNNVDSMSQHQQLLESLRVCAEIAAHFKLSNVLDTLVV